MTKKAQKEIKELSLKSKFMIALAGNCNVGKSTIFNNLTGLGVLTANYAGKTVELNMGLTRAENIPVGIIDLPGIYSMGCISEDQYVARQTLLEYDFDAVIYVLDATNLERNLYMLLQFMDLEIPVIAALNLVDEAHSKGLTTDEKKLEESLGIKVIRTSAIRGEGLDELISEAMKINYQKGERNYNYYYGSDIEKEINKITDLLSETETKLPVKLSNRATAILLLEKDRQFIEFIKEIPKRETIIYALEDSWKSISETHGEEASLRLIRERHGIAGLIAANAQTKRIKKNRFRDRLWRFSTNPVTGYPFLIINFTIILYILFAGGNWLSDVLSQLWTAYCSPFINHFIDSLTHNLILVKTLKWGFDDGMLASISVGIPYVFMFYLILSLLEDTGYLNSAAFLMDRALHVVGLHGRAFMPLASAIGCNVPAIIGTRILSTFRERLIAIFLIVLIACSARTAVIIGAVSRFLGWFWAILIIFIDFMLVIASGILINRHVKGDAEGLVMEVFPLRSPHLATVIKKTWIRFADFVWIATPIVIAGSMLLGYLYETQLIWKLSKPLSPLIENWLGLPPFAGLTLIFAVLRKELALQFLITLAMAQYGHSIDNILTIMSKEQIFTFTLFNTLYLPCLATISVIKREIGLKWTLFILISTLTFTILFTGIIHHFIVYTGVLA